VIGESRWFSHHAFEIMRCRAISQREVMEALGADLIADGALAAPRATAGCRALSGAPVLLGRQTTHRSGPRSIVLGATAAGRHMVMAVVPSGSRLVIVTLWDAAEHPEWWRSDLLRPTRLGERELPPTYWYVDEFVRRQAA
jgi:hypothetical protein